MSGKQNIELRDCLKRYFGFDSFKGNQEAVIRNVLDGKDTFVLMPTGGGKSLCYQLPALMMDGVAIVISPLIALMKDQIDQLRRRRILAESIHSGMQPRAGAGPATHPFWWRLVFPE